MARVQSQQILDALDGMRDLNGNTDELLTTIQGLKTSNSEAIRQMRIAADLLRRLLQSRGDMDNIMNAVNRHGADMGQSVDRIRQALNDEPSPQQMQEAIRNLESASNEALQAGLPAPGSSSQSSLNRDAAAFVPGQTTGQSIGGYGNKKRKLKKKHHGGYAYPGSPNKSYPVSKPRKVNSKTKTRRRKRSLAGKRVSSKSQGRASGPSKRSTRRRRSRR